MKAGLRLILFLTALLLFLIGGAYLVARAQGWVLDFDHFRIVKTGGIYLKFSPADANLKINGKLTRASPDLLTGGTLIKNLLPGNYKIDLNKENFSPWEKNLLVQPGMVAAKTSIKLWPAALKPEPVVNGPVLDFWLTDQGLIYQQTDQSLSFKNKTVKGQGVILADPDSNYLIAVQSQTYFLTDLTNPQSALNLNDLFNSLKQQTLHYPGLVPIQSVRLHPFSPDKLIISTASSTYVLDLSKITLTEVLRGTNILSVNLGNNNIFALDKGDKVLWANLILGTAGFIQLSTSTPVKTMAISPDASHWLFTDKTGSLLVYDSGRKTFNKIAQKIKNFNFSPDSKAVVLIYENDVVSVFYLENYDGDFHESASTTLTLNWPTAQSISDFNWLKNLPNHFLVLKDNNLVIGEIDPYPPLNFYTLTTGVKKYILNGNDLYALKMNGDLIRFDLNQ